MRSCKAIYHGFDYAARSWRARRSSVWSLLAGAIEWVLERQHEAAQGKTARTASGARTAAIRMPCWRFQRRSRWRRRAMRPARFAMRSGSFRRSARHWSRSADGGRQERRRARIRNPADHGSGSRFHRDRRHSQGCRASRRRTSRSCPTSSWPKCSSSRRRTSALEALRKLLNDEIRSRSKTNVVETKRFSERLESAIARYHTNAISTVEVLAGADRPRQGHPGRPQARRRRRPIVKTRSPSTMRWPKTRARSN